MSTTDKKFLDLQGLSTYNDKLVSFLHSHFHGILESGDILVALSPLKTGEKLYCLEGSIGGGGNTNLEFVFTQNAQRALYIKAIAVNYTDANGESQTYSYAFPKKTFSQNNSVLNLGGIDWMVSATLETDVDLYCGYSSEKGQQFGSSSQKVTKLVFSSSSFAGCIIHSIKIETSGASSTRAYLTANIGDISNYLETFQITSTSTEYSAEGDVSLEAISLESYSKCFLEKNADGTFTVITPSNKSIYINTINNRLYQWIDNELTEVTAGLTLGTEKDTAYRGDYGQRNYEDIQKLKTNLKLEYKDSENYWKVTDVTLPANVKLNLSKETTIEGEESEIISTPITLGDSLGEDNYGIKTPALEASTIYAAQSGDVTNLTLIGSINIDGGISVPEPIFQTDAASKNYVDNSTNEVLTGLTTQLDQLSADIELLTGYSFSSASVTGSQVSVEEFARILQYARFFFKGIAVELTVNTEENIEFRSLPTLTVLNRCLQYVSKYILTWNLNTEKTQYILTLTQN